MPAKKKLKRPTFTQPKSSTKKPQMTVEKKKPARPLVQQPQERKPEMTQEQSQSTQVAHDELAALRDEVTDPEMKKKLESIMGKLGGSTEKKPQDPGQPGPPPGQGGENPGNKPDAAPGQPHSEHPIVEPDEEDESGTRSGGKAKKK